MRRLLGRVDMRDVIAFGGLAILAVGAGLAYPPAAWIVIGLGLVYLGLFHGLVVVSLVRRKRDGE